jgi:CRP-like cAMP-binding protein
MFFIKENMQVNVKSTTRTTMLVMPITKFNVVMEEHRHLERNVLMYMNKIVKLNKRNPLDFIVVNCCHMHATNYSAMRRRLALKGTVLQILLDNR